MTRLYMRILLYVLSFQQAELPAFHLTNLHKNVENKLSHSKVNISQCFPKS